MPPTHPETATEYWEEGWEFLIHNSQVLATMLRHRKDLRGHE
jgi:hypothetical protein